MAQTKLEVILQQDLPSLGKSGDLVRVRPGYARNFLVPQQVAVMATARNKAQVEHSKRIAIARAAKDLSNAEAVAKKLASLTVVIAATAGDEDRLYGAVTTRDVAVHLEQLGVPVEHKMLRLAEPIRKLGSYEVSAKLGSSVTATIKVNVIAKK